MVLFFPLFVVILGFTLYGRSKFRRAYDEELKNHAPPGMTGRALAQRMLDYADMGGVEIAVGRGPMPDFYDPAKKRLTLARQHYDGTTFAALGIAAHEVGHALQHREGFKPLFWRISAIRATMYLSLPLIVAIIVTTILPGKLFMLAMIAGWAVLAAYNLITMPTEMDATQRAKDVLRQIKPFRNLDQKIGIDKVMKVAGAAYIEGVFSMLSWFFSWLAPWWRKNTQPD